ncbi:MAG: hypothetical protein M3R24_13850, partial [Chloroflexota bacterium]|nr:hypothetical protein [Chloroflexota bacterium]
QGWVIMGMLGRSSVSAAAPARSISIGISGHDTWSSSSPQISIALLTNDWSAQQPSPLIPGAEQRDSGLIAVSGASSAMRWIAALLVACR